MLAINRKLVRDLWQARGQVLAIALVVASGVAMFVLMRSTFASLDLTKDQYYEHEHFADIFASLKRAPLSLEEDIAHLPGVARSDTRVVVDVTLDLSGQSIPISGRLISVPDHGRPVLNDLVLRSGRWVSPYADDEAIASEAFAGGNHLAVGDSLAAIINGHR